MKWTVLHAVVVEAESANEAEQKSLAWMQDASMEGITAHRMCGHPMAGDIPGCPCHVSNRVATGSVDLSIPVPS